MSDICDRLRVALKNRYRIDRELGRGGMAIVYLAEDIKHARLVALKVLRPELSAVLGADRFLREIGISARLQHPHILPLHDSGEADGLLYYVMPFVDGESLRDRLTREGSLPWKEAVSIACEIASATQYAHGQGIVHRDIKPGNILLSQGHAVVADFGIARAVSGTGDDKQLTKIEFAVGTPPYMSPEQALSDPTLDGRSDIYSLGCVLYEMLTGVPPAETSSNPSLAKFDGHAKQQVPKGVRGATMAALAVDRENRYQTAAEMRDALMQSVRGGGSPILLAAQLVSAGAVILALVYFLALELGLPGWVFQALAVVTAVQIIVLMLASRTERAGVRPHRLNRRRIRFIGAVAVVAVGLSSASYMAGHALGVGPQRSVFGVGTLDSRERIILADFENRTSDSLLGAVTTDAFRIDFAQSPVVSVVDPSFVTQVLSRMERSPSEQLTADLAREIAVREGIKAVLAGEITTVGSGYMLTVRVVSAEDATVLAADRVSAASTNDVIAAIDRLSKEIRGSIGEPLRSLRENEALQRVTTHSLEALRTYSQASRAIDAGDVIQGRALLKEALILDSTFAMAHRRLGLVSLDRAEQVQGLTRAYQFRERLTDREKGLTIGAYHLFVTGDDGAAIESLAGVLEHYPEDPTALNSIGLAHVMRHDHVGAERYFIRALQASPHSPDRYAALIDIQTVLGKMDDARLNAQRLREEFPNHPTSVFVDAKLATVEFDYVRADSIVFGLLDKRGPPHFWRGPAYVLLAGNAFVRGRLEVGERYLADAMTVFENASVPGEALASELQLALVDLFLRGDHDRALTRVDTALQRYPPDNLDPLNRPYLQIAQLYAFSKDTVRAGRALNQFAERVEYRDLFRSMEIVRGGLADYSESRLTESIKKLRRADSQGCPICLLPYIAEAYDKLGAVDSTISVLERYVAATWLSRINVDIVSLVPSYERLARNYEKNGDLSKAAVYYGRIVDLWQDADSELQAFVDMARDALRRTSNALRGVS